MWKIALSASSGFPDLMNDLLHYQNMATVVLECSKWLRQQLEYISCKNLRNLGYATGCIVMKYGTQKALGEKR